MSKKVIVKHTDAEKFKGSDMLKKDLIVKISLNYF